MKKHIFSIFPLLLFLFQFQSNAQQFRLDVAEAKQPVYLKKLHVDVEIVGNFAITTTEMLFHNPNNHILEGQLEFPLLESQSVIRFAMDVNGDLREAVPVQKNKGQAVFEDIERKQVDPGLLEKTQGNNYRARIYPLPKKSHKRVIIATLEELQVNKEQSQYQLPMNFGRIKEFSMKLRVKGPEKEPAIQLDNLDGLNFSNWREDYVTEANAKNFDASGILSVAIPPIKQGKAFVESYKGKTYFYAPLQLDIGKAKSIEIPESINLFWDSSSSAEKRSIDKEFAFLDQFFAQNKKIQVQLIRFRNDIDEAIIFDIKKGDWGALRRELENTLYDGGTNLLQLSKHMDSQLNFLFSDGMHNFGTKDELISKNPIICVNSNPKSDTAKLRKISNSSAGKLIDLIQFNAEEAYELFAQSNSIIEEINYNPTKISFVYPSKGEIVANNSGISGVLKSDNANIEIKIRKSDAELETLEINLSEDTEKSSFAARKWAMQKLYELEADFEKNQMQIEETGKHFGIVTKNTSLIILETVEDYLEYKIEPPVELLEEYKSRLSKINNENSKQIEQHLNNVIQTFKARIEWFEKDWPKDTQKQEEPKEKSIMSRMAESLPGRRQAAEATTGMASPPPPAETEDVYMMNSFEVNTEEDIGYLSTNSTSGTSLNTSISDESSDRDSAPATSTSIQLKAWKPESTYAEYLNSKTNEELYHAYLEQKSDFENSSAFYLDCFDIFIEKKQPKLALRILSNLAEMQLENHAILRILAYRLMQAKEHELALPILEKVKRIRAEEPQSYRDLALVHEALGNEQKAIDLLWHITTNVWDQRFSEIELIALAEMNAIIARSDKELDLSSIDKRLIYNMPLDIRVVLTWDADNTDIDLWVIDPNNEKCYYSNNLTFQGGKMSRDYTLGYGPEEFLLKSAKKGKYIIKANYYGNSQQVLSGSTTIQLSLQKNFGTNELEEKQITLRLKDEKEVIDIGEFIVE